MDAAAEVGRNPVSTRFSLSMEKEQADAGRDCRTRLARPILTDRETSIFPVQLTTHRIVNLTRLIHTLAICVTIQT